MRFSVTLVESDPHDAAFEIYDRTLGSSVISRPSQAMGEVSCSYIRDALMKFTTLSSMKPGDTVVLPTEFDGLYLSTIALLCTDEHSYGSLVHSLAQAINDHPEQAQDAYREMMLLRGCDSEPIGMSMLDGNSLIGFLLRGGAQQLASRG